MPFEARKNQSSTFVFLDLRMAMLAREPIEITIQ